MPHDNFVQNQNTAENGLASVELKGITSYQRFFQGHSSLASRGVWEMTGAQDGRHG